MTWCVSLYRPSLIDVEEEVCVVDSIVRSKEDGEGEGEKEKEKRKKKEGAK